MRKTYFLMAFAGALLLVWGGALRAQMNIPGTCPAQKVILCDPVTCTVFNQICVNGGVAMQSNQWKRTSTTGARITGALCAGTTGLCPVFTGSCTTEFSNVPMGFPACSLPVCNEVNSWAYCL